MQTMAANVVGKWSLMGRERAADRKGVDVIGVFSGRNVVERRSNRRGVS